LCCTVLRVDELRKLGGVSCAALGAGGCTVYARRPHICRAYQCLWLQGTLDVEDRPDRLGAVLDLVHEGGSALLAIREAEPGVADANPRLAAIAARYREAMPVRITRAQDALLGDAPVRTLLAGGEELVATGDTVVRHRAGAEPAHTRAPWLERGARRLRLAWQRWRIRGYGDGRQAIPRGDA
jgi:Fe-S-cluster containining protein